MFRTLMIQLAKSLSLFCLIFHLGFESRAFAVVYGESAEIGQYSYVGQVRVSAGKNNSWSGTGTLIAPDIVLTAAHVVVDAPMPVLIDFVLPNDPRFTATCVAYRINPGYLKIDIHKNKVAFQKILDLGLGEDKSALRRVRASDLALMKLDRPYAAAEGYPTLGESPSVGTTLRSVGFGNDELGNNKLQRRKYGLVEVFTSRGAMVYCKPATKKFQLSTHGDSGGPLLTDDTGAKIPQIAAVVQGGDFLGAVEGVPADSYCKYVLVESHRQWLNAAINDLGRISVKPNETVFMVRSDSERILPAIDLAQLQAFEKASISAEIAGSRLSGRGMSEGVSLEFASFICRNLGVQPQQFHPQKLLKDYLARTANPN